MGRGATQDALRASGITIYELAAPGTTRRAVRVKVVDRPEEAGDADIVVLAVKNYSLEAAAGQLRDAFGDRPIIVSMANGIDNQRILPKFFSRVVYGVVGYNARQDAPAVIGYQRKGPLLIGAPDPSRDADLRAVHAVLAPAARPTSSTGCRTPCTPRS